MRPHALLFAFAICLFSPGAIAAALAGSQYVIISTEPAAEGLAPGRVLKVDDSFDVPEGVTVTLLGEDGTVSAVPGPANITITDDGVGAADNGEKRSAFAKVAGLLAGENKNAQSLGASRGVNDGSGEAPRIEPWAIPVDRDGNGCARAGEVLIGRDNARTAQSIALEAKGERLANLNWPQGESLLTLPGDKIAVLPEFEIRASGKATLVLLHRLPAEVSESDTLAVLGWMIDNGCDRQAVAFARSLAQAAK
jgi:hypothetical protein